MTSSESEERTRPKKRSRPNVNGGEGNTGAKKARGRPRVNDGENSKDASDRRRLQIRLAQRAYRQRKETIISSLKTQNAQLRRIIEDMNRTFSRYNESTLQSGILQLNPSFTQEMKQATATFATLSKAASATDLDLAEDENGEVPQNPMAESLPVTDPSLSAQPAQESQNHSLPTAEPMDIGWGYTTTVAPSSQKYGDPSRSEAQDPRLPHIPAISESSWQADWQSSVVPARRSIGEAYNQARTIPTISTQHLPFGLMQLLSREHVPFPDTRSTSQIFSVNIPSPEITPPITRLPTPPGPMNPLFKSIPLPQTYSFDETSFARRLTRASLESAFVLLSKPEKNRAQINKIFKLSVPHVSLDELRDRLKTVFTRTIHEDLDFLGTPFIHLGGAGTHYPRRDAQGNEVRIPNAWTVRRIGPLEAHMVRAEKTDNPSQTYDMNVDLTGFEGEWFDAYDVQGYLEAEKGCYINPQMSFAEVLVDIDEPATTAPTPESRNIAFARQPVDIDLSAVRRLGSGDDSDSPSLSNGSSSAESSSSQSTTPPNNFSNGNLFNGDFGVGMSSNDLTDNNPGFHSSSFPKFSDVGLSSSVDAPLGLDIAPLFSPNFSLNTNNLSFPQGDVDMTHMNLGLDLMGEPRVIEMPKRKEKKTAFIDVITLINQLVYNGVCLGRAPGFRRKDVDAAFKFALNVV